MRENFIPCKESIILNELGFDRACLGWYETDKSALSVGESWRSGQYSIKAPLYQQAFRWFREKHNLNSFIIDSKSYNWYFNINDMIKDDLVSEILYFKTYEEAELECLKKLIEITKK
jgi:hypothetical protein